MSALATISIEDLSEILRRIYINNHVIINGKKKNFLNGN